MSRRPRRMPRRALGLFAVAACQLAGCNKDVADPQLFGDTSTTTGPATTLGTTTTGADTSSSSSDSSSSSTDTTTTSTSSSTGEGSSSTGVDCDVAPDTSCLVNEGVVVRYFLDEAAGGQLPQNALDAIPQRLNIPHLYDMMMPHQYIETAGNRGIRWPAPGGGGSPLRTLDNTKIHTVFEGATQLTIETVVEVEDVGPDGAVFVHAGLSSESRFSLGARLPTEVWFLWQTQTVLGRWTIDLPASGRTVFHLVLDTTQAVPEDRVRLHQDGVVVTPLFENPPELDASITIGVGRTIGLGNRDVGGRSIQGTLYYAALYSSPLTPEQIDTNVAILTEDDDAPGD